MTSPRIPGRPTTIPAADHLPGLGYSCTATVAVTKHIQQATYTVRPT